MAEVFVYADNGEKVTKVAALACQGDFKSIVDGRFDVARSVLEAHRDSGDSYITMERPEDEFSDIDWQVTLNDERGQRAAMTIEKGRRRYTIGPRDTSTPEHGKDKNGRTVGAMAGVRPLGVAFGLPDMEAY